jgi:hypothetical protein
MDLFVAAGLFLSILLLIVQILSFVYPMLGAVGVALWIVSYIYIGIFTLYHLVNLIKKGTKNGVFFSFFAIAFFVILVGINIPTARNLSLETTQEIGCALNQLTKSTDRGFNQTCLFGYPARQYILPALPSFINRSLTALHTGGSIYFFMGLILFISGILEYYSYSKKGDFIVLFLTGCFFHLYYFNHFLFLFEQSIYPFSFGLMLTGTFFIYLAKKSFYPLIVAYFILLYLIFSYTPSLSLYILSVAFLVYLFINSNKKEKVFIGYILISSLIFFAASFLLRRDIQLADPGTRSSALLIADLLEAFRLLFLHIDYQSVVSFFLTPVFLFTIVSGMFFLFGKKLGIIVWWIVTVLSSSVLLKGYTYYVPHFRLHRALIAFPVFFGILAYLLHKIEIKKVRYLAVLSFLTFGLGFYIFTQFENTKTIHTHYPLIEGLMPLTRLVDNKSDYYLYFSREADLTFGYENLFDLSQYFYPHMKIVRGTFPYLEDCKPQDVKNTFIVLKENDPCYASLHGFPGISGKEHEKVSQLYSEKYEKFDVIFY